MYIKKAELTNFGKFHQKTISFSKGLNVVYGENESGKSTLHSFLLAMLFGLEKKRGRAGRNDMYQRFEPWNAAAYYAGSLEFAVTRGRMKDAGDCVAGSSESYGTRGYIGAAEYYGRQDYAGAAASAAARGAGEEKDFRIERKFYHKEKDARLYGLEDGEELSVAHGDLDVLLGDVRKRVYENTYCIAQAAVVTETDFAALLERELVNSMYGGDGRSDVSKALRTLDEYRRKEEQKLKQEQQRRREQQERLEWEQEMLYSDLRKLEEKLAETEQRMGEEGAAETERRMGEEERTSETERRVGEEGAAKTEHRIEEDRQAEYGRHREGILWRLPLIGRILRFFRRIFLCRRGKAKTAVAKSGEAVADTKTDGSPATAKSGESTAARTLAVAYNLLAEQIAEKKTRLLNIGEEIEEVNGTTKNEHAIQTELKSIRLAQNVLEQVARESYRSGRDGIQAAVSAVFSGITDGRYDNLEVTETGQVTVCRDGRLVEPWQLSRGAMEQLYLALRLGVGRYLMKEEPMPLLLDETFCAYDDRRLARTLRWLADQQEQVILFTCQKREMELLEQMGAVFHKILL